MGLQRPHRYSRGNALQISQMSALSNGLRFVGILFLCNISKSPVEGSWLNILLINLRITLL
jgi:hypothetical protein